jgi:hypothetical protein
MAARNQAAFWRTIVTPTEALGRVRISELASRFPRAFAPLRPLAGGEGGTRRGVSRKPAGLIRGDGRVRWVAPLPGTAGIPHLTPTLSAPKGGEGDFRGRPSWTLGSCANDGRELP